MPRIIAGRLRSLQLASLDGDLTRPTGDRVKEGLFSALAFRLPGSRCLDLFAGSGQIGLEALSRGARQVVFVESARAAQKVILKNLSKAKIEPRLALPSQEAEAIVLNCDAERALRRLAAEGQLFDFIYFDPPWAALPELWRQLAQGLAEILAPSGLLVMETEQSPEPIAPWRCVKTRRYGRTQLHFWQKEEIIDEDHLSGEF